MKFTVFNKTSGEIQKIIDTPVEMLEFQFNPEIEEAIEGDYDDSVYYISNGLPAAKGSKPTDFHVFDFDTKQWVDPRTPETQWEAVRMRRNALLAQSDWTQLPDVPLATKEAWAAYRQALRDITNQPDPFNIVWPVPPG